MQKRRAESPPCGLHGWFLSPRIPQSPVQHRAQEIPRSGVLRMGKELLGRSFLHDQAFVHEDDTVGHLLGKAHLVGDDDHGHALSGQVLHDVQHLAHHLRIQRGGGLVEEHHVRVHAQGAHDGDALLLSSGKLGGIGVGAILQAHALQQAHGLLRRGGRRLVQQHHGRKGHVAKNGHVGKEVEVLKDHAHPLPVQVDVGPWVQDVHAFKIDGAFRRAFQQVQGAQQGGFSRTRRPDDHRNLPLAQLQIDAVQGLEGSKVLFQSLHANQSLSGHCCAASFPICSPRR